MEGGAVRHNIEKGPPNDYPSQICFNLVQRFQVAILDFQSVQKVTTLG
jgi:hypothetical protein